MPAKKAIKPSADRKKAPSRKKYATIEWASAHCGVTPTTFRYYMNRYPDMPIHQKNTVGGSGNGYQIDLRKLDQWRAATGLLIY